MSAIAISIQALLADDSVAELVGDAVHPVKAPQGSATCIVLHQISEVDAPMLTGPQAGFYRSRVQVDCRARTATAALALGEAVKAALGSLVRASIAGCEATFTMAGVDGTDALDDASLYRRHIDFYCHWRTAT